MNKLFKSSNFIRLNSVNSTNTYISSLPQTLLEGSVVITKNQTSGRGQGKNKWESEPGKNLTFSIVLTPTFLMANQQFYISKMIALALSDFVLLYTDSVSIKWPNDIYVGNKKIAGILIENTIEGHYLKQTIVGIGININQREFSSNAPNAVSVSQLTNEEFHLDELLETLLDIIEYRYNLLKDGDLKTIDENYLQILYRKGHTSQYIAEGKMFDGIIQGVDTSGELIIKDNQGTLRRFWHKEVEFIITPGN